MRSKPLWFALGSLPLLAACSFLLDFDALQGGKKPAPDASAGSGGADTDGGDQAGAPGACEAATCNDG